MASKFDGNPKLTGKSPSAAKTTAMLMPYDFAKKWCATYCGAKTGDSIAPV